MKLFFAILCLFSLVTLTSSSAVAPDEFVDLPDVQELIQQLDVSFPNLLRPKILKDEIVLRQEDEKCHKCVDNATLHILNATWNHIEEKCKNETSPVRKARCEWVEKHQNQTWGYLSVTVRPTAIAWGYCVGKEQCKHGNKTEIVPEPYEFDPLILDAAVPIFKKLAMESNENWSIEKEDKYWDKLPDKIEKKYNKLSDDEIDEDEEDEANGGILCKICLSLATEHTLNAKVKKVEKVCQSTRCPVIKKWCDWAAEYKDFVRGQLYAHIQPWKYAIGYCIGARGCPHPPPTSWNYYMKKKKKHNNEDDD